MSWSWMEKQGQVGDLGLRSKEELQELLLRQEGILGNRRLLQTLPDKGKKIKEFADRILFAIEQLSEEERRRTTVCDGRAELQSMYKQAFTAQQRAVFPESASVRQNQHSDGYTRNSVPLVVEDHLIDDQQDCSVPSAASADTMVMVGEPPMNWSGIKEGDLVKALEGVTLDETRASFSSETIKPFGSRAGENYFNPEKKPHYVSVLERKDTSAASRKQKFKPNQLLHGDTPSAGSSSPSHSSEGSSPLSVQERREQDRKHLNDITAAKLPPLHHSPAQLVSLEESMILLKEQTKKQQELQAKMAAQKLSEGLKLSMGSFTPDATFTAAYREVRDEGAELSSDDD